MASGRCRLARTHVPGVNVLFLDGRVEYVGDPNNASGTFATGVTESLAATNNWAHDSIWMNIDKQMAK